MGKFVADLAKELLKGLIKDVIVPLFGELNEFVQQQKDKKKNKKKAKALKDAPDKKSYKDHFDNMP